VQWACLEAQTELQRQSTSSRRSCGFAEFPPVPELSVRPAGSPLGERAPPPGFRSLQRHWLRIETICTETPFLSTPDRAPLAGSTSRTAFTEQPIGVAFH